MKNSHPREVVILSGATEGAQSKDLRFVHAGTEKGAPPFRVFCERVGDRETISWAVILTLTLSATKRKWKNPLLQTAR
jgi:hypothetical protein